MLRLRNRQEVPPAAGAPTDIGHDVLRFLATHRLPATPANYALGHTILSKPAGLAARTVDAVVLNGAYLTQAEATSLSASLHVGQEATGEDEARANVRREAIQLSEAAARAVAHTADFGRALVADQAALGQDGSPVEALVAAMIERSAHTEAQLTTAAKTIETLRQEIEVARGDAARDALTGLPNRRGILAEIEQTKASRHACIAICDIDHFKTVNDRYGHIVGDRVLKLVAATLAGTCSPHIVGRWGGEEFMVVMRDVTPAQAAEIVEAALHELASRNVKLRATDEPLSPITFSAGVVALHGHTFQAAVAKADRLLYDAKEAGRNCILGG